MEGSGVGDTNHARFTDLFLYKALVIFRRNEKQTNLYFNLL